MSAQNKKPIAPLSEEEIEELVPFFDLLAKFDFEDKQKEQQGKVV